MKLTRFRKGDLAWDKFGQVWFVSETSRGGIRIGRDCNMHYFITKLELIGFEFSMYSKAFRMRNVKR